MAKSTKDKMIDLMIALAVKRVDALVTPTGTEVATRDGDKFNVGLTSGLTFDQAVAKLVSMVGQGIEITKGKK
jgi:hypothetical protein